MKVIRNDSIGAGPLTRLFSLTIQSNRIANTANPGQFVHIRLRNTLLRRPFSIHSIKKDTFEILYKIVGRGTKILSDYQPGEEIDVLGPLGNKFSVFEYKDILIVGGGIGVAPLHFIAQKASAPDTKITAFIGADTKEEILCEAEFSQYGEVFITTEDGSYGTQGVVTDLLETAPKPEIIFACGPLPMLKAVKIYARTHFIPCQLSLEQRMGCGLGVCLGCAIPAKNGYKYVCKDGPVFWADEVEI